jgi:hypothetical protein
MFEANGSFVLNWGQGGSGDGEFQGPANAALATNGAIYIADEGNYRVQKFEQEVAVSRTIWSRLKQSYR